MTKEQEAALQSLALWWGSLRMQYQQLRSAHPEVHPPLDVRRVLFFGTRGQDYVEVKAHELDALAQLAELAKGCGQ